MSSNSRLTLASHILTWMAKHTGTTEFATSERIARSVNTNPVILRRLLGLMENAHLVNVQRGSNAGWKLARRPEEITLLDVYRAVEPSTLFAMHHTQPNLHCEVGCGISSALTEFYANAQQAMEQELAHITIADVLHKTLATTAATRSVEAKAVQSHSVQDTSP